MISSSKLTVVAVEQYLHDLIIIFFFLLPPLKQAKLVLVMEMRLFTPNPIITTTYGAQQIASRCGSVYVSPSVSSESQAVIRIFPSMQYMKVVFGNQEHALKFERSRAYCNLLALLAFPLIGKFQPATVKTGKCSFKFPKN
jgi:hypothetical protein